MLPLLAVFAYRHALAHAMGKPVRPGFYVLAHLPGFAGNLGWPLAAACVGAACAAFALRGAVRRPAALLSLCGACYLAPLAFLAPPGVTVVRRGYMLVGSYLWVLCAAVATGQMWRVRPRATAGVALAVLLATLWGTAESVFFFDRLADPAGVRAERGCLAPDPGTKAAGWLVRKYVPRGATVLATHRAVEPPNLLYYFRRPGVAFYDLTPAQAAAMLRSMKGEADVVICEASQVALLRNDPAFPRRATLCWHGTPRMWLFARRWVPLPEGKADVSALNRAFDRDCAWRVSLW